MEVGGRKKGPIPSRVVSPPLNDDERLHALETLLKGQGGEGRQMQGPRGQGGSKYFRQLCLEMEYLIVEGSRLLEEPVQCTLFVRFRSERKAVYTLLQYYGLEYSSVDTQSIAGQDGPRHCCECLPEYVIPAKKIVVTGPSRRASKPSSVRDIWFRLFGGKLKSRAKPRPVFPKELWIAPTEASLLPVLPIQVLVLILGQLPSFGDVFQCALVCKSFAAAVRCSYFWARRVTQHSAIHEQMVRMNWSWLEAAKHFKSAVGRSEYYLFCKHHSGVVRWPHYHH